MQEPERFAEKENPIIKVTIELIGHINAMLEAYKAMAERWTDFCSKTESRFTKIETEFQGHLELHQEQRALQKEFEDRLTKKLTLAVTTVAVIISGITFIINKLSR